MKIHKLNTSDLRVSFSSKTKKSCYYNSDEKPIPQKDRVDFSKFRLLFWAALSCYGSFKINENFREVIAEVDKKANINWVEPQQKYFDSRDEVMSYAKRKVLEALNSPKPHEYNLIINDETNEVVAEFCGDSTSVKFRYPFIETIKSKLYKNYSVTTVHGHPGECTTPISLKDFFVLNNNECQSQSVVFNPKGEYSILKKKKDYKKVDEHTVFFLMNKYFRILYRNYDIENPDLIKKIELLKRNTEDAQKADSLSKLRDCKVDDFQLSLKGINLIDKFWKEVASKYELEYITNYSYLEK